MKVNKLTIIIDRDIQTVFEYTTNPSNTHLWINFVAKEIAESYPPIIWTLYKNYSIDSKIWDIYKVKEFISDNIFTLTDSDGNYHVQYTYRAIDDNSTELEYYEWMEDWILTNPFSYNHLETLKQILENS